MLPQRQAQLPALREEQAKARHYRDAYETQAQQVEQLRKRVAELERQGCR